MDGAILVVAATDGPMPQTRSTCFWPARSASPTSWSPQGDMVDDEEILELVEMEVRELLRRVRVRRRQPPSSRSRRQGLQGDEKWGESSPSNLMERGGRVDPGRA